MPGHRFFTLFDEKDKEILLKDADEFQHLSKVLRLKEGDAVEIVNGMGCVAQGVILEVSRAFARIGSKDVISTRPSLPRITLACAVPKKSKFETIIEKTTELGVDRIVPLLTARTEFALEGERCGKKAERYRRVVMNAAKQCKRLWFPDVTAPMTFNAALKDLSASRAKLFIPWLEGERMSLPAAMAQVSGAQEIVFFIGPEGDFTPEEVDKAVAAGAMPVSLGPNVLKVDTAAMAVVAAAMFNLH